MQREIIKKRSFITNFSVATITLASFLALSQKENEKASKMQEKDAKHFRKIGTGKKKESLELVLSHSEGLDAVSQVVHSLVDRSNAGVGVRLFGLRAHFSLREENADAKLLLELGGVLRRNVGAVLEALALLEVLGERGFVDDAVAGRVDESCVGLHAAEELGVDHLLGLVGQRTVDADVVAGRVELLDGVDLLDALLLEDLVLQVRVDGADGHAEALGDARDAARDGAVGVQTEGLAAQLEAGLAEEATAGERDHQTEDELGDRVGVLPGGVHHDDLVRVARGDVDGVVAGAGSHDDLELLGGVEDGGGDLVASDDHGVGVGDGGAELFGRLVALEPDKLEALALLLLDLLDGDGSERLFGGDENLEGHLCGWRVVEVAGKCGWVNCG